MRKPALRANSSKGRCKEVFNLVGMVPRQSEKAFKPTTMVPYPVYMLEVDKKGSTDLYQGALGMGIHYLVAT